MTNIEDGQYGEALAAQALQSYGYAIINRNWRCPAGEVDIIARDGDVWVFVEVKLRRGRGAGSPEEAVSARKQQRLLQVAQAYLAELELDDVRWRVDVIAIELSDDDLVWRLDHYRDAVCSDG
ncbi:MAG: YraN family protein [Anaerolineae bacterium]|nr:YraN family protein [Anaerolineae bacterium]